MELATGHAGTACKEKIYYDPSRKPIHGTKNPSQRINLQKTINSIYWKLVLIQFIRILANKGLQAAIFHLSFAPMLCNKSVTTLLAIVLLALSGGSYATEQNKPVEELSLFERYTNSAQDLILKGLELVGVNYRRGGTNPDSGLDCSGFVQLVFKDAVGLILPRTAREQSRVGDNVDKTELKAGDLVFFNTMRHAFSHVGIYLGDNRFLHAPRTGAEVRVEDMRQSYWVSRYNGARRIVEQ